MTNARLDYSVSPVTVTVLDYSKVQVRWATPTTASTGVTGLRLVRSTDGFSETPEDGVILFTDSTLTNSARYDATNLYYYFVDDGSVSALVGGQYIFYNFWAFYNGQWQEVGRQLTVLAKDGTNSALTSLNNVSTHDRFMDSLPRILTSTSQNSLDEIDAGSDLYVFFKGFSYTFDELITSANLIMPAQNFRKAAPVISTLALKSYGFTAELNLPIQNQKKLAAKALYITQRKGTLSGLRAWLESVTGFNTQITTNQNLILGIWDSYLAVNTTSPYTNNTAWAISNYNAPSNSIPAPSPQSQYALSSYVRTGSYSYTTTPLVLSANVTDTRIYISMDTVYNRPLIPIVGGLQYDFSAYFMKSAISNVVTPDIQVTWFGPASATNSISTSTRTTLSALTTSWARLTATYTAPAGATAVSIQYRITRTGAAASDSYAYMSQMQVSVYDGTTHLPYYEPRGVSVVFEPRKANLLYSPSFENATAGAGWTVANGTVTAPLLTDGGGPTVYGNGTKKLRIVSPGSGVTTLSQNVTDTFFKKSGARAYTFSIYAKASVASTMTMNIGFYGTSPSVIQNISLTTGWQRFSVTWQLPTSATGANINVYLSGTLAGATVEFDAAQLELGYSATEYFDGNSKFGYWTTSVGEQDQTAQSVQYPNLEVKINRIQQDISKYLPNATPYWIQYYGPDSFIRYSGIS